MPNLEDFSTPSESSLSPPPLHGREGNAQLLHRLSNCAERISLQQAQDDERNTAPARGGSLSPSRQKPVDSLGPAQGVLRHTGQR